MKLLLAYFGDPILRKKADLIQEITPDICQLVEDMFETMEANDGCGLAAPQVHHSIALFITQIPFYNPDRTLNPGKRRVFINPKILSHSEQQWICEEGCLSIPGIREDVSRPIKTRVQALDLEGNAILEDFEGFDAHVMLHENDHLNGVLYIDRLSQTRKKALEGHLRQIKKDYYLKQQSLKR